jgi:hypothetical protein
MIRLSTILWTLAVMVAGYAMFQVKYEVGLLEDRLTQLNHDIAASREETRVLDAEWSLLSDPQRLDRLNKTFLHLTPVATAQIGSLDQIPFRPGYSVQAPMLAKAGQ